MCIFWSLEAWLIENPVDKNSLFLLSFYISRILFDCPKNFLFGNYLYVRQLCYNDFKYFWGNIFNNQNDNIYKQLIEAMCALKFSHTLLDVNLSRVCTKHFLTKIVYYVSSKAQSTAISCDLLLLKGLNSTVLFFCPPSLSTISTRSE